MQSTADASVNDPLRVLIIDDSEDDAELVLRQLRRGGYSLDERRVDSADALLAALEEREWDIIVGDYTMPRFSGMQALALVRKQGLDVPVIFVSGTMGEETAVAAMRAGAQDFLTKGQLIRLVPAIERELRDAKVRREGARIEIQLRAAEARFSQILAMAADAVIAVDQEYRIVIFNQAAEQLFGYGQDEVIGRPLDLLLPLRAVAAHQRHMADFARSPAIARPMSERSRVTGRRRDGSEFPAEISISKLQQHDGTTTFTAIVRDVTERERAEAKLGQLSQAVEQSANLVIITDAAGIIEYVNPKTLEATGYSAEEVIGRTPALWKSGKTSDAEYAAMWRAVTRGEHWRGSFENRRKDGSSVPVSATISPVRSESGLITHFIGIEEDVSQHKAIEAQLQQAQKMELIGQLTGGIAHDFNNILAVIIGNIELLQEQVAADAKISELSRTALDAGLRGAELTHQLLAFARRQPLEAKPFALNQLVSSTVNLLSRTLGEQIRIETLLAGNLAPGFADPTQVASALVNLAVNARDAMPEGGTVVIETANVRLDEHYTADKLELAPGDYVMLAVSDSGHGIPPEILSHVFEPFFTTKATGKGTGLGLSMVYGFAKQSGGHVQIYSEVGHGTTVRLYLPCSGEDAGHRRCQDQPIDERPSGCETILLVEDNEEVRRVAVMQLQGLGYRVHQADSGAAALGLLQQHDDIDLLFSDVVMPGGMTGTELAAAAVRLRPDLKVLLTSGFSEVLLRGQVPGPTHFIAKPYRLRELAQKLREVLDGS